jgi:hypothetical protein
MSYRRCYPCLLLFATRYSFTYLHLRVGGRAFPFLTLYSSMYLCTLSHLFVASSVLWGRYVLVLFESTINQTFTLQSHVVGSWQFAPSHQLALRDLSKVVVG